MDKFNIQHSIIDEDNNIDSLQIKIPSKLETPPALFPQSSVFMPMQ